MRLSVVATCVFLAGVALMVAVARADASPRVTLAPEHGIAAER